MERHELIIKAALTYMLANLDDVNEAFSNEAVDGDVVIDGELGLEFNESEIHVLIKIHDMAEMTQIVSKMSLAGVLGYFDPHEIEDLELSEGRKYKEKDIRYQLVLDLYNGDKELNILHSMLKHFGD